MTDSLSEFLRALEKLPDGWTKGHFRGRPWSATVRRSEDDRRIRLFAEEIGGTDIVSFNLYFLSGKEAALKPCEMSSGKVIDFVLEFEPTVTGPAEA